LDFPLGGGVAFLDFGGIFESGFGVFLGRTGGSADSVAAGSATDEKDDIAGGRAAAEDVGTRGGCDDGSDFETLGDVSGMIDFRDLACGEADLVPVGRVTVGGDLADFFLREFPGEGFSERSERVCRAGDAHGLIHV